MKPLDVLVVGAGPTGLTLAVDLVRRGLDVRIIDQADRLFEGPRAKGVQPRTLEVFDDLGVLDEILDHGGYPPKVRIHLGAHLTVPIRPPHQKPADDVPYPNIFLIPQSSTNHVLLRHLQGLGGEVEFDRELLDLTQDDDLATATVRGPDGVEEITARYVVGADGGSSCVRKQLDIPFVGSTDEDERAIIADTVCSGLRPDRLHVWISRHGSHFLVAWALPRSELFQWHFRLAPGEEAALDAEALNRRIRTTLPDTEVTITEVRWASVYRPNIRLAASFRRDRVFIAGDAAHVHTPAGGQGLNTGIQDSYNLGWKLGQVLAGADPALLDTYEAERRPIAEAVLGLSTQKYQGMRRLRPSSFRRGREVKQLDLTYHGGPLCQGGSRTQRLEEGDRAPDSPLVSTKASPVRLHELLRGPHFTAVAYGERAARALTDAHWPTAGAELMRVAVSGQDSRADLNLTDSADTFKRIYGLTGDTLILIRPDGYIGLIANSATPASFAAEAALMLPADPAGTRPYAPPNRLARQSPDARSSR